MRHFDTNGSFKLAVLLCGSVAVHAACSSDAGSADVGAADAGSGFHADASEPEDAGFRPDAGPRDAGARDASAPPDAGFACLSNGSVTVEGEEVRVGETSMASSAGGARADLSCDHPSPGAFSDPMFIRGCLDVLGAPPTAAELAQLEVAVFEGAGPDGAADPSFDPATWADREPGARIAAAVEFDTAVAEADCPSRVQVQIGFDAPVGSALLSEHAYTLRVRTATSATAVWATTYMPGIIARNDSITKIGINDCTAQNCYYRYNFHLMRAEALAGYAAQASGAVPGATNLKDGLGAGYVLTELYDCNTRAMRAAVAGVRPSPLGDGYLTGTALDLGATESSADGLYLALGFTGQTALSAEALEVRVAVGANSYGVCTEAFAGARVRVWPDAITVFRASRDDVLP